MLRMFRLLVSSRYRRVRKMQLHLVLFALFIDTIFKEDNSPGICIHSPTYGDSRGIAISLSPQDGAYTRALESENHYPRPSRRWGSSGYK